jgi:hypothetical protein
MKGGMGFRDLQHFNLALLAKQGWRLISNPKSLLFRVLKSKYFPRCPFMEAVIKPGASAAWRGIIAGRAILEKGLRWSVGNGSQIRIWEDRWIPTPSTYKITSPRPTSLVMHVNYVSDLIDTHSKSWRIELLDTLFFAHDVHVIKSIPISSRLPRDKQIWAGTTSGIYTVKSGYQLLCSELSSSSVGESSNPNRGNQLWRELWSLPVAAKIRIFIWLACLGILPTKASLHRYHITTEPKCDCCYGHGESVTHALWFCESAKSVWQHCSLSLDFICWVQDQSSFMDVFDTVIHHLSRDDAGLFCTIAWKIWFSRNEIRIHGIWRDPSLVFRQAASFFDEFSRCAKERVRGSRPPHQRISHWTPPMADVFKINIALCSTSTLPQVGIRILVRDHVGNVMASRCSSSLRIDTHGTMELKSFRDAVDFARDLRLFSVVFKHEFS